MAKRKDNVTLNLTAFPEDAFREEWMIPASEKVIVPPKKTPLGIGEIYMYKRLRLKHETVMKAISFIVKYAVSQKCTVAIVYFGDEFVYQLFEEKFAKHGIHVTGTSNWIYLNGLTQE